MARKKLIPLHSDSDWNEIHEAISKVENVNSYDDGDIFGTYVSIVGRKCSIKSGHYGLSSKTYSQEEYYDKTIICDSKKRAVIKSVNDFINWHNNK